MPTPPFLRLRFRPLRRARRVSATNWAAMSPEELFRALLLRCNPRHRALRQLCSRVTGVRRLDEVDVADWAISEAPLMPELLPAIVEVARLCGGVSAVDAAEIRWLCAANEPTRSAA